MKGFNESQKPKSSREGSRSCSYCSSSDHVANVCPNAESDWKYLSKGILPHTEKSWWGHKGVPNARYQRIWYSRPEYWSDWYKQCNKASIMIDKRKAREEVKSKSTAKGKSVAKKCGFCAGTGHNRRDCAELDNISEQIVLENRRWRSRFFKRYVVDMGLSVGAVVQVERNAGYNKEPQLLTGLITQTNMEKLSMFCMIGSYSNTPDSLRQPMSIDFTSNGKPYKVKLTDHRDKNSWSGSLQDNAGLLVSEFDRFGGGYSNQSAKLKSVIAKSSEPVDPTWITQGHRESVVWLTKKYSLAKLESYGVLKLLEKLKKDNDKFDKINETS